uniref:Uncharacterized protein n=1 Tax=Anguilla anguilla TaxID=7936 RepID=A0A0E9PM52_ANGAN
MHRFIYQLSVPKLCVLWHDVDIKLNIYEIKQGSFIRKQISGVI